jgi:hypothetical protein
MQLSKLQQYAENTATTQTALHTPWQSLAPSVTHSSSITHFAPASHPTPIKPPQTFSSTTFFSQTPPQSIHPSFCCPHTSPCPQFFRPLLPHLSPVTPKISAGVGVGVEVDWGTAIGRSGCDIQVPGQSIHPCFCPPQ